MNYISDFGTFRSTDTINDIAYYVYTPKRETRAIVQLSHGMCEYVEQYAEFTEFLTSNGILFCGNDHLGHGRSVRTPDDLGYFGENGWRFMVRDMRTLTRKMREENPGIPFFLLGHSMGSFAARAYISDFEENLSGCILLGTSGGEILMTLGKSLCRKMIKDNGSHYRSETLNRLSMDLYNERIPDRKTDFDWTTRNVNKVNAHLADKQSNFIFTADGFLNLVQLLSYVSRDDWASEVPTDLPVFLMSGDNDPVGNYGKGVEKVYERLRDAGSSVEMKLYGGARHELLYEINREEVYADILDWILSKIQ